MGAGGGHGTGLANLRARLKALHGDAAELSGRSTNPGRPGGTRVPAADMRGELPEYLRSPVLALRAWTGRHSLWACFAGAANFFCNGTPLANTELQADELRGLCYNVLQFGFPLVWLVGMAHSSAGWWTPVSYPTLWPSSRRSHSRSCWACGASDRPWRSCWEPSPGGRSRPTSS